MRLDQYLAQKGIAKSRSFAKALIADGYVKVGGKVIQKPAFEVVDAETVVVTGVPYTYVSRGGVKLEAALERFQIDPAGMCALDIGASSGGFTDCLLRRGARKVYAVDSGVGQLAPSLAKDPRVVSMERCNARTLQAADIGETCDICVMDVSFISQKLILPSLVPLIKDNGILISLIKPQFECGQSGLSKNGIVKDWRFHRDAIRGVAACAAALTLAPIGLIPSPVQGGDGNREFLLYCRLGGEIHVDEQKILEVCRQ